MSEYRFHLQKYRSGSKTTCPSCGKSDVLSGILMNKAALAFPVMSASVITRTVVAIITHLRNTSRIILMCWK